MSSPEARRRREAVLAGHHGNQAAARAGLGDASPAVREAALGALARMGALDRTAVLAALADEHPAVRRRACEEAAAIPSVDLAALTEDPDASVVEAAAWALGEQGAAAAGQAVEALVGLAESHPDAMCRETAVAALGAMGDPRGRAAVLRATTDRPAVRRRAVVALAAFEGDEVDEALRRALADRDWQVRQAARDLLED